MLKTHPEWEREDGKWKKFEHFAISNLSFSIRPAFFNGLLGSLVRTSAGLTGRTCTEPRIPTREL
jgi:hypothetical protein